MSDRGLTWYKRDPIRFLDGVQGLGPDVIGAYAVLLDLIYARGGETRRDDRHLSGVLGCSVRKATALTERLIDVGKIDFHDGFITNSRAKTQAKSSRNLSEARANAGRKGGESGTGESKNRYLAQASAQANASIDKRREEKREDTDVSSIDQDFGEFWKCTPKKVSKGKARQAYAKARKKADAQTILIAMKDYAQLRQGEDHQFTAHPASWLSAERWNDEAPPPRTQPRGKESGSERAKRIAAMCDEGMDSGEGGSSVVPLLPARQPR